jgi:hypothetical protein
VTTDAMIAVLYGAPAPAPVAQPAPSGESALLYPQAPAAPAPASAPPAATPAEALYGKDQAPETAHAPAPSAERQLFVDATPQAVRELREAAAKDDPSLAMYADPMSAAVQLFEGAEEMAPDQRAVAALELTRVAQDNGFDANDLADLTSLVPDARAITAETLPQAEATAAELLNTEFGSKAAQALLDARRLVERDPRVKAMLEHTNLGNHPRVVLQFAKKAARERAAGRLK